MDKKSITGLVLIAVILFGFTFYQSRQSKKFAEQKAATEAIAAAERMAREAAERAALPPADTLSGAAAELPGADGAPKTDSNRIRQFGESLFAASTGEEKSYTLETDLVKITFSNLGGKITGVELKDYKSYTGAPLCMFREGSSRFDVNFFIRNGYNDVQVQTGGYYFECDQPARMTFGEGEQSKTVSMRLPVAGADSYVEYLYTVYRDNYMIDFNVRFVGMASVLSNQPDFGVEWGNVGLQNEKGFKNENNYTTVIYKYPGDKTPESLGMNDGSKSEEVNNKVEWVAFKQQFFSSVLIADGAFQNAQVGFDTFRPGQQAIKEFNARLTVPMTVGQTDYGFRFYFGPNKYSILKKYGLDLQRLIPLGWNKGFIDLFGLCGVVNRGIIIPLFDFLGRFIGNYGIIILIMTVIVKLAVSPLNYKSYLSMAKMKLLKPQIDALNEKYPKQEDAMKKQQAMMELYKKSGVNPMGGCLPMLIQMPLWIAMFRFFPSSIELRGQHFLWADDLTAYDSVLNLPFNIPMYGDHVSLFALLFALSMFFYSKLNSSQTPDTGQMAGMKFMMLYLMPVMMLLFLNNNASGLAYYYFVSNLLTMLINYGFRFIVPDEKLRLQMQANVSKPVKKSKFQQRYEEMLRQQQAMQQQQRGKKR